MVLLFSSSSKLFAQNSEDIPKSDSAAIVKEEAKSKPFFRLTADADLSIKSEEIKTLRRYTTYFTLGASYIMPKDDFKDVNDNSYGINFQIESRKFCNLWYGVRIDYNSYKKYKDIDTGYYKTAFIISPEVRYIFGGSACKGSLILPYIQTMLSISSIDGQDKANLLGLGGSVGGGAAFPFIWLKRCWALELSALYNAPNFMLRADKRKSIEFYSVNLALSVGL